MNKWLPTPENINALPEYLRDYIHQLEATCDPAGLVRENMQLKDTNDGLQLMYRKAIDGCSDERMCALCFSGQGRCETVTPHPPTAEGPTKQGRAAEVVVSDTRDFLTRFVQFASESNDHTLDSFYRGINRLANEAHKILATQPPSASPVAVPDMPDLQWLHLPEIFAKFIDYAKDPTDANAQRIITAASERFATSKATS